jgi:phage gp36-like protein
MIGVLDKYCTKKPEPCTKDSRTLKKVIVVHIDQLNLYQSSKIISSLLARQQLLPIEMLKSILLEIISIAFYHLIEKNFNKNGN